MTELITRSGAWLLQQAAALPDTVFMKTVGTERGWFETVTGIATTVLATTMLTLGIILAPVAWQFWRAFRKARGLLERLEADTAPLVRHARSIADNLDYITTSIRSDVAQVNATIASANRRLHQAVEHTETRMNEFNALLQVVQQEAEQAFVSTASVVHGVRTGAAAFGSLDDDDIDENASGDDRTGGGIENGDDSELDEDPDDIGTTSGRDERQGSRGGASARPRLRSQRRGGRD